MRLFVCTDHNTHWPVGGASIIIAENEIEAEKLLNFVLKLDGLKDSKEHPYTLEEVDPGISMAMILNNGEY